MVEKSAEEYNALGIKLAGEGHYQRAAAIFKRAISLDKNYATAYCNLGIVLKQTGRLASAVGAYKKALSIQPDYFLAHYNLGNAYQVQGKLDLAESAYRSALSLNPKEAYIYNNLGTVLKNQGKLREAIPNFESAINLDPSIVSARTNLGSLFLQLGEIDQALKICREVLELDPQNAQAHAALGEAYRSRGENDKAIKHCRRAVELGRDQSQFHYQLGQLLFDTGRITPAAEVLEEAIKIEPAHSGVYSVLLMLRMMTCNWPEVEKLKSLPGPPKENPFLSVAVWDNPRRNLRVAQSASRELEKGLANALPRFSFAGKPDGSRIRIGYLSYDFYDHATAHLTWRLFGLHDRQRFEVFSYSYGPDDHSFFRQKIAQDSDHFVDITKLSYPKAAQRIRDDRIDILIDLKGYTKSSRTGIAALRPAPIQVSWLGFPGTTGADFLDYALVDKIVVPPSQSQCFTEKLAYLPDSYQVNSALDLPEEKLSRKDFGLPTNVFVFCSFNHTYKIEPVMWEAWMRILKAVPGSALWLMDKNPFATKQLRREARQRGIDPRRLVFAKWLPRPQHLLRHRLADLGLDTRIYNGHTTTSDALFAGLPVITLQGKHFASRVASSLLTAVGLPELITHSLREYENLAVDLALRREKLEEIKRKLEKNKEFYPLFDTGRFVANLERAYLEMWEIYRRKGQPQNIEVREN